jgi:hypothetical protein
MSQMSRWIRRAEAATLLGVVFLLAAVFSFADEPFKGPLDPVTMAFRDAASKLMTAPTGAPVGDLLRKTVLPAVTERAQNHRKRRSSQLASWHTHRANGDIGAEQGAPVFHEDEIPLSAEGIPALMEFSGPKKPTPRSPGSSPSR